MRTNRFLSVLLALALVLALAGCGDSGKAPASDEGGLPSAPAAEDEGPEETPPPREEDEGEEEESWPQADNALVREIIKTYGAREETLPGDTEPSLVVEDAGLFTYRSNWDRVEELAPVNYFSWFLTTTFDEDETYKAEHYTHPLGDNYGWFFPRELFEERVQRHFRVSSRHLRLQDEYPCYDPELDGYTFGLGVGIGERYTLTYSYTQEGGFLTIDVTVSGETTPGYSGRLCVFLPREGEWEYMWWQYRPDPIPTNGQKREDVTFLTREQWDLLDKADRYYTYFNINGGSFHEDRSWQSSAPEKVIDGVTYLKYTGSLYGGWEDFYRDMCSVFTPAYFQQLNQADFGLWGEQTAGPLYREVDGDLYCSIRDGGGNQSYLPGEDRYLKMLADEETVIFSCYSYYCEREDVMSENPTPTSVKERRFRLENTPEGWRVAKYTRF